MFTKMKSPEGLGVGNGSIFNLWLCSFGFERVVDLFPYLGLLYLPAEEKGHSCTELVRVRRARERNCSNYGGHPQRLGCG